MACDRTDTRRDAVNVEILTSFTNLDSKVTASLLFARCTVRARPRLALTYRSFGFPTVQSRSRMSPAVALSSSFIPVSSA